MMVDTERNKKLRSRKYRAILPMGGGEAISLEKMEYLYASLRLWDTLEEDDIPCPDWNGVDK